MVMILNIFFAVRQMGNLPERSGMTKAKQKAGNLTKTFLLIKVLIISEYCQLQMMHHDVSQGRSRSHVSDHEGKT